jgi:hypothetical protein
MHFSVWCSEIFARPLAAPKDEFEKLMTDMYQRTCKNWPRASIPAEFSRSLLHSRQSCC